MACIACELSGLGESRAELHHPLTAGRRRVHPDCVIPLCPTHHRLGVNTKLAVSRHPWAREFERRYGTDLELWAIIRSRLVAAGLNPP